MALVTKTFSDIITFTRASTGTYFNSSGTLVTAAINGFRLDYNPSTLAAQGLLIEEQRVNSIRNNTMVGAAAGTPGTNPTNWALSAAGGNITTKTIVGTGTENGITYIDVQYVFSGAATATIRTESSGQIAATNTQTWTGSSYVKLVGGALTNCTVNNVITQYDGAFASLEASLVAIVPTSSGLATQRGVQVKATNQATVAFVASSVNIVTTGAADITLRIGLPQLELGAFATSVIPTSTVAVTRSADAAIVNTLTPWYNQTEGTLYAELGVVNLSTSTQPIAFSINDTTANNRWSGGQSTSNLGVMLRNTGGVGLVQTSTANAVSAGINKLAVAISSGASIVLNGGTVATSATYSAPTVTRLEIGRQIAAAYWNGYIRRITYYPRRLSDAELQTITA